MKKILTSLALLSLALGVVTPVLAADTASVTATVTPGVISVTVTPGSFDYGYMPLNTPKTSYEAGETSGITATVGSLNTDLEIKGANATSATGTWTLASSVGVLDEYVHGFGLDANPISYAPLTVGYQALASVSANGSQVFGLEITTPTISTVMGEAYSTPVTVLASWGS